MMQLGTGHKLTGKQMQGTSLYCSFLPDPRNATGTDEAHAINYADLCLAHSTRPCFARLVFAHFFEPERQLGWLAGVWRYVAMSLLQLLL